MIDEDDGINCAPQNHHAAGRGAPAGPPAGDGAPGATPPNRQQPQGGLQKNPNDIRR